MTCEHVGQHAAFCSECGLRLQNAVAFTIKLMIIDKEGKLDATGVQRLLEQMALAIPVDKKLGVKIVSMQDSRTKATKGTKKGVPA